MTSIIIPSPYEKKNIANCLELFVLFLREQDIQVIFVCNGYGDHTAKKVKKLDDRIQYLVSDIPSKGIALNLGDSKARFYPKIYLDADSNLSSESVKAIIQMFIENFLAVSTQVKMNTKERSWIVQAFYNAWQRLRYREVFMGSAIYDYSAVTGKRVDCFPDIISDNDYIKSLFSEHERILVIDHFSIAKTTENIFSLVKIKTRSWLRTYQSIEQFPELITKELKFRSSKNKINH